MYSYWVAVQYVELCVMIGLATRRIQWPSKAIVLGDKGAMPCAVYCRQRPSLYNKTMLEAEMHILMHRHAPKTTRTGASYHENHFLTFAHPPASAAALTSEVGGRGSATVGGGLLRAGSAGGTGTSSNSS